MYESVHSSLAEDFSHNLQSPGSSTAAGDDFFDSRTSYLKYYREKGVNRDSLKGRGSYYEGGVASGDG